MLHLRKVGSGSHKKRELEDRMDGFMWLEKRRSEMLQGGWEIKGMALDYPGNVQQREEKEEEETEEEEKRLLHVAERG